MATVTPAQTPAQTALVEARRIVVKIGSALLVEDATVRQAWLNRLSQWLGEWASAQPNRSVVIVSSGAIAVGRGQLGLPDGSLRLEEKQAAAATGQISLAAAYRDAFGLVGKTVAQVLITLDDTETRRRYLNARDTLETLLGFGVVPVINENDTVATGEIRYGDNDRLSARVAAMVNADALVLLSDIDGLYSEDPRKNPDAAHFPLVTEITSDIEAMAGDPPPGYSSGGMKTKIAAAKIATLAGTTMIIADGRTDAPLHELSQGARATVFAAPSSPQAQRKIWIAGHLDVRGSITIDDGAVNALGKGKSLLPSGVTSISGEFTRGDCVRLLDANGAEKARGLTAFDADEIERIAGHHSSDIEAILGYHGRVEVIHRDDLVMTMTLL